jgi:hypothetical protein
MLVDKGPHNVDVSFEYGWKNIWTKGDVIIWQYWYEKL